MRNPYTRVVAEYLLANPLSSVPNAFAALEIESHHLIQVQLELESYEVCRCHSCHRWFPCSSLSLALDGETICYPCTNPGS